jgi:hypothetical protein
MELRFVELNATWIEGENKVLGKYFWANFAGLRRTTYGKMMMMMMMMMQTQILVELHIRRNIIKCLSFCFANYAAYKV